MKQAVNGTKKGSKGRGAECPEMFYASEWFLNAARKVMPNRGDD